MHHGLGTHASVAVQGLRKPAVMAYVCRAEPAVERYLIVMAKSHRARGTVLRLHRTDGCWQARTLSFADYEVCDLHLVPRQLYTHYCRSCWP